MTRTRRTYVYDETLKRLVEKSVETRVFGVLAVGDLPDFISPVDGSIVNGRAGLREHDRRNGTTNVADYTETWAKRQAQREAFSEGRLNDPKRTEAVVRAYNKLQGRSW